MIRLSHRREASLFLAALWGCLGGCQSTFPSPPIEPDNTVESAEEAAAAIDACPSTPSSTRQPFSFPNLAFDAAKLKLVGSVYEGHTWPKLADCPARALMLKWMGGWDDLSLQLHSVSASGNGAVAVAVDTSGFEKGRFLAMTKGGFLPKTFDVKDSSTFALVKELKAQKSNPRDRYGNIAKGQHSRAAIYRVADNGSVAWKQDLFETATSSHFIGEVNIMAKSDAVHVCAGYAAHLTADWGPPPVGSKAFEYAHFVGRFSVSAASGKPVSLALLPNGRGVFVESCWMTDDATIAHVRQGYDVHPESEFWPDHWDGLVAWDGGGELWRSDIVPFTNVIQVSESAVASFVFLGEYSLSKQTWSDVAVALRQWDMKDGGYKDLAKIHTTGDGWWPAFGQIVPKSDGGLWLTADCITDKTNECAVIGSGQSLVTLQGRSSAVLELAPDGGLKTVAACSVASNDPNSDCSVRVLGAARGSTWFAMVTYSGDLYPKPTASFGGVAAIGRGTHVFTVAK